jgi:hypothetical protein
LRLALTTKLPEMTGGSIQKVQSPLLIEKIFQIDTMWYPASQYAKRLELDCEYGKNFYLK